MILLNTFSGKQKVIKMLFFSLTAWKWLNYIRVFKSHCSWNNCLTNHQSKYHYHHFYKAPPRRPQVLEHWAFILQMRKLDERKEKHGSLVLLVMQPVTRQFSWSLSFVLFFPNSYVDCKFALTFHSLILNSFIFTSSH